MPNSFNYTNNIDSSFKVYHELMARKVQNILLVSTPYDAWIMEEDGRLSERIVNEYRGLNLSHPPRLTWVATAAQALVAITEKEFDLVITMPQVGDIDAYALGQSIHQEAPDLPIIVITHSAFGQQELLGQQPSSGIIKTLVWSGNTDLLVALIKSVEDRWNAKRDTELAQVRIILFVENSPVYTSSLLPILYKELVNQTRSVLERKLNEEHRLLTMRARPKILVAEDYEEAVSLYEQFEPYILGVISDVQFAREGVLNDNAGIDLLSKIKKERFDIALLLASSDPDNAARAETIPATFIDKNSSVLHAKIHDFFKYSLAFGDFIFRTGDGTEVARASDLRSLETCLRTIPEESLLFHGNRNDFSRWLFTRTETALASQIRDITSADFTSASELRQHLVNVIHARREERQRGIVADFAAADFDLATQFFKIGQGSLGGKGRGLAFVSSLLARNEPLNYSGQGVNVFVPQTLVITTEGFETFIENNDLGYLAEADLADEDIAARFLIATFPQSIENDLRAYLEKIHYPLAVRSSSLFEDAQYRSYAGMYRTYMLSNDDTNLEIRLAKLVRAIKLVYASTYYREPKAFSYRVGRRTDDEQMGIVIQQLIGERYGDHFYPAISGVAQSYNYYPFAQMAPEDGFACIAMGLGRMVAEGEKTLCFSPKFPHLLPHQSTVDSILENAQRYFYALKMGGDVITLDISDRANLERREVVDVVHEPPMQLLASTYVPEEHRIRDTTQIPGHRVLTFTNILKFNQIPLADILIKALNWGREGMGRPVEMEFSVNFPQDRSLLASFAFLQLRPMTARIELAEIDITQADIKKAFLCSHKALGNVQRNDIADIVYVKPDMFEPGKTREISLEISSMNALLSKEDRPYVLIGPGRWGTADHWLGIPVKWFDISGVSAIIETKHDRLSTEPSQGSHFFHNLMTFNINYIYVANNNDDFLDWSWITSLPIVHESTFVAHARLDNPFTLKVDGRTSRCVGISR